VFEGGVQFGRIDFRIDRVAAHAQPRAFLDALDNAGEGGTERRFDIRVQHGDRALADRCLHVGAAQLVFELRQGDGTYDIAPDARRGHEGSGIARLDALHDGAHAVACCGAGARQVNGRFQPLRRGGGHSQRQRQDQGDAGAQSAACIRYHINHYTVRWGPGSGHLSCIQYRWARHSQ
jgi:hypothetical protein